MQVFKAALRTATKHPIYPLFYAVFLSFMGVFMAGSMSFGSSDQQEFLSYETTFSVIDRDNSDLSYGLVDYLETRGTRVDIEDTELGLQDAVAKNQSSYILIVPDGFGESFMLAAHKNNDAPTLETVYSYYSAEGSLMDQSVNEYLGIARTWAMVNNAATQSDVVSQASSTMSESAEVSMVTSEGVSTESQRFVFYLEWGTYTLFAAIVVCVGVLMSVLNRTDLRRRNLVAPTSRLSYSLQVALASFVVMAAVWLWTVVLGMAIFNEAVSQITGIGLASLLGLSFIFATIPLSVGFLLGQCGVGELVSNTVGNILGMAVSFLGGVWISIGLLDPAVQTVAHFTPAYWYVDGLQKAVALTESTPTALAPIFVDIGVMLLFSASVLAMALVVGRMRAQSNEAGGNAAAEIVRV